MKKEDRENAVLASFLYANDVGENTDNAFLLCEECFTSPFRKRIAKRINAETSENRFYAVLSYDIEGSIAGTVYEDQWLNLLSQTPMPFSLAKRYHNDIKRIYDNNIIRGV